MKVRAPHLMSLRYHDPGRNYASQPHCHVGETIYLVLTHGMRMEVTYPLQDQVFKELVTSCFLFLILSVVSDDCYVRRDSQNIAHKEFWFLNGSREESHPLTSNIDTDFMYARQNHYCVKPIPHSGTQNYPNVILNMSVR